MNYKRKKVTKYRKFTKEEINNLDMVKFSGDINVFSSGDNIDDALSYLMKQKIIGFDTETRPRFTKGPLNAPSIIFWISALRHRCHVQPAIVSSQIAAP